jgi:putative PEP-CTERM system histidine kinase
MNQLLPAVGYGSAALVFGALLLLSIVGWRRRFQAGRLILAVAATMLWAVAAAAQAAYSLPILQLVWASEVVRNLVWVLLLLHLLKPFAEGNALYTRMLGYVRLATLLLALLMLGLLIQPAGWLNFWPTPERIQEFSLIGQLLFAVLGLALVEQLFRNTPVELRWGIKHLCFGLGALFVYDFYLYTDALLFQRLDPAIWSARGFVVALAAPLIGMTAARNPDWSLPVFISRRMVLHSTTLFSAGLYMLVMALVGYYIRTYGGEWGGVLQIAFLFGAVVVLVALLFSGQFRARVRIFFDKHFFNYRYDYRDEWLRVIGLLADSSANKPLSERVIWALSEIVESPGGLLWLRSEKGDYRLNARFNAQGDATETVVANEPLLAFMQTRGWVIDVRELHADPEVYDDTAVPAWVQSSPEAWLIVPLMHETQLLGFVLLLQPRAPQSINWENLDLLKTVGQQSASYLAFQIAAQALAEARQFEGFNRLSAFVIHDLKNLIAQLSLVARNAGRHKHNPEFVDDAVATIENAVGKMNRLMIQLQSADVTGRRQRVDLAAELQELVISKAGRRPIPGLRLESHPVWVSADPDRLSAVLGHVVQNAQEATPDDGSVEILLRLGGDQAIVEVSDTGCGMDADFIKHRLFRPFDSTKGLTGMGIGAYECREVISALGGQVVVESEPGRGSRFRVMLPLLEEAGDATAAEPELRGQDG